MKEFHRRDFANRTGLAQAWTVKSADRLFTGGGSLDARLPVKYTNRPGGEVEAVEASFCLGPL